jgi:hypothetical protein
MVKPSERPDRKEVGNRALELQTEGKRSIR